MVSACAVKSAMGRRFKVGSFISPVNRARFFRQEPDVRFHVGKAHGGKTTWGQTTWEKKHMGDLRKFCRDRPRQRPAAANAEKCVCPRSVRNFRRKVARATGLEPATSGVTGRHSNQLSYARALDRRSGVEAV